MTFTEIQTDICDRLGITAPTDVSRIGRAINRVYKIITADLGLKHVSRRNFVTANTTIGLSTVTFTGVEKMVAVYDRNVTPYRQLSELTMDELRSQQPFATSDAPTQYAIVAMASDSVQIRINTLPASVFLLSADAYLTTTTLSGTDEPAFSESAHDILIHGVLIDEYMKIEKPALSKLEEQRYHARMGELRLWVTVSTTRDLYQGQTTSTRQTSGGSGGGSGSGSGVDTDLFIQKIETLTPAASGAPVRLSTPESTVASGTSEGLRRATVSLFDTNVTDVDNALLMIDVRQTTNTGAAVIKKTGLHVKSYTLPDNGGDTSGILSVSTGGGPAITAYKASGLRPSGFASQVTSTQPALEVGSADYGPAIVASAGVSVWGTPSRNHALQARMGAASGVGQSDGIIVWPTNNVYDDRIAIAVAAPQANAAPVNMAWCVRADGSQLLSTTSASGGAGGIVQFGFAAGTGSYFAAIKGVGTDAGNNTSGHLAISTRVVKTDANLTECVRVFQSGGVSIGNTTDPGATNLSVTGTITGLSATLNQGAADDGILTFKSSDVAHGMTSVPVTTDTYGEVSKSDAGTGGLRIRSFSEGTFSLMVVGVVTTADTTKSTAGVAPAIIQGAIKSGTATAAFGATDANLLAVRDGATARFLLDSDGDSHQDVGTAWTNFDDGDDLARLNAVAVSLAREGDPLRDQFVQFFDQHRAVLDAMPGKRLVTFNDDGHHFVNMSRLAMLHTGAIRQLAARLARVERPTIRARLRGWFQRVPQWLSLSSR